MNGNKIFKGVILACALFGSYQLSVIAGNSTSSVIAERTALNAVSDMASLSSPLLAAIASQGRAHAATGEAGHTLTAAKPSTEWNQTEPDQKAQSVHRQHKTSCADLKLFTSQGVELTPQQETELAGCHISKGNTAKQRTVKGYGVTVKIQGDQVYVDGSAAALDEKTAQASVFSSGLYLVTVYKNGRVALQNNGHFVGWLH